MADIWDYKVTYKYGNNVPGYSGFHSGEDRTAPKDTPVTVNGHLIGRVGTTGLSTGYHLHIGKWKAGQSYNPNGGGEILADTAVVTQVDTTGKTNNGKFVRVNAGGYDWVYLHLNSVNVKVGDKLRKEVDMYKGKSAKYWYDQYVAYKGYTVTWRTRYESIYNKVKASLGKYLGK